MFNDLQGDIGRVLFSGEIISTAFYPLKSMVDFDERDNKTN